ncbi:MAG TPA: hypothetical protein VIL36_06570 [Acidimicrobiales bacterium]
MTGPAIPDRAPAPARPAPAETTSTRGLAAGLVLGVPLIAYGVRGALVDAADTHPAELARWVVGLAVVNDLLVLPAAMLVGLVARRMSPSWAWPAVRSGLLASAVLAFVAWPLVRGYGVDPTDPSLLPRRYGAGLAAALAAVWVAVPVVALLSRHRRDPGAARRGPTGGNRDDSDDDDVLRPAEQSPASGRPEPGPA